MIPARKKIAKEKGAEPDDFESSVAQVIIASKHLYVAENGPFPCSKLDSRLAPSLPNHTCVETARHMQALFDLEATNSELKQDLRDLYITSAAEIDVGSTRKAIVIHVRLLLQPAIWTLCERMKTMETCQPGHPESMLWAISYTMLFQGKCGLQCGSEGVPGGILPL